MQETQQEKFLRLIMGSDMDFYEQFLSDLTEEELQKFLEKNPDFLQE